MTILITLIAFGLCMLLTKTIYWAGIVVGYFFKGIGILLTLPFRLIGHAACRL